MCAASVYPEPGSNSHVYRVSTKLRSAVLNFGKTLSMYIEYYLNRFSSFALHNLLIETTSLFSLIIIYNAYNQLQLYIMQLQIIIN